MKAIILAAGYATRLYPLTLDKPKALLPVKDKPIINYIIDKISQIEDIDEIFIITNDKFYMNFVWWLNQYESKFNQKIEIINDGTTSNETRLGGIGDLNFVIEKENIKDEILVISGDNLFDFNLQDMIDSFNQVKKTTAGIYDIKDVEEVKKMSVVEIKDGKITFFEEKPSEPKSTISSIGIYIFSKSDIEKIREYMKTDKSKDGPGYLIKYFSEEGDVYAFILEGRCFDIGSKETYEKVNKEW